MNEYQVLMKAERDAAKLARRGPSDPNHKVKQRAAEKRLAARNYSHVSAEIVLQKNEKTGLVTPVVQKPGTTLRKHKDRRPRLAAGPTHNNGARRRAVLRRSHENRALSPG